MNKYEICYTRKWTDSNVAVRGKFGTELYSCSSYCRRKKLWAIKLIFFLSAGALCTLSKYCIGELWPQIWNEGLAVVISISQFLQHLISIHDYPLPLPLAPHLFPPPASHPPFFVIKRLMLFKLAVEGILFLLTTLGKLQDWKRNGGPNEKAEETRTWRYKVSLPGNSVKHKKLCLGETVLSA